MYLSISLSLYIYIYTHTYTPLKDESRLGSNARASRFSPSALRAASLLAALARPLLLLLLLLLLLVLLLLQLLFDRRPKLRRSPAPPEGLAE